MQPFDSVLRATALILALSLPACSKGSQSATTASSSATATATVPAATPTWVRPARSSWPVPIGPRFAVVSGVGVGPIRFGATVQTIERLMEAPCDFKTPEVCRYYKQAIDFELENGVVKRFHIHRFDRPAGNDASGKPRVYGTFNGGIPPDLQFGMLPWAIQEHLGKPARIEKAAGERGASGTYDNVEIHHYDGLILEYDRLGNNQPILGGMIVEKSGQPKPAHS